jgi:predicted ATPase/class 3 adenylate cyclase
MAEDLPSGTVTMLFSDIEGSTRLLSQLGVQYGEALSDQRSIIREQVRNWHGREVGTEGDSFFVVFRSASDALGAALAAQLRLRSHPWRDGVALRVRMGLHTGEPVVHEGDYVGMDVHRAARIAAAAHGGQIVVSATTAENIGGTPPLVGLKDLGWHRLKDLPEPEHILQIVADGLDPEFPPLKSLGTPTNLPRAANPIFGRDRELAEIAGRLAGGDVRLVTLTGPGGTGKTRLAIAVAHSLAGSRADGVYFVPLAMANTADVMWSTIAENIGVPGDTRSPTALLDHIRPREMFLILDNLEQLSEASDVVNEILLQAPNVAIVTTSRRPLHLSGEYQYPVPPLGVPGVRSTTTDAEPQGAIALFVHRARMVRPSFRLTDDNLTDVVEICSRLDGMPLAIELAAARTKLLTPHAILARLDKSLELGGSELERPTRQRTLRQAIAWSYDLLTPEQRTFFSQLGVFGGSCDLDALGAVTATADPLDQVAELVDVSLVQVVEDRDGEPRLDLLQTVRAFARECLESSGQSESAARRHAQHYLGVAERLTPRLRSAEFLAVRSRIEAELDNLRAALAWSLSGPHSGEPGDVRIGIRLCKEMSWFWYACGYPEEGRRWLEQATQRVTGQEEEEIAVAHGLAVILLQQGETTAGQRLLTRCLDYWRARGDDRETAKELNSLGVSYRNTGDYDRARELLEEGVSRAERSGDKNRLAAVLSNLGIVEIDVGHPAAAIELFDRAVALDQELEDSWGQACDLVNLAAARLRDRQVEAAEQDLLAAAPSVMAVDDTDLTVGMIELLAMLRAETADVETSARLCGAADAIREEANLPRQPADEAHLNRSLARSREAVSAELWHSYVADGRALTGEEAIAEGLRKSGGD